jgi:predicted small secreted protein
LLRCSLRCSVVLGCGTDKGFSEDIEEQGNIDARHKDT